MFKVTSLSAADKPYYSVICRYIETDSQKKRKLVLPIRELKPSSKDILGHFQGVVKKIKNKHATLLNAVDNKLLIKCLLIAHYHSDGSPDSQSIELADKLMKMESKSNNRRVSFREPPEAIKYENDEDGDEDQRNNDNTKSENILSRNKARELVTNQATITDDYDEEEEEDDDFAF